MPVYYPPGVLLGGGMPTMPHCQPSVFHRKAPLSPHSGWIYSPVASRHHHVDFCGAGARPKKRSRDLWFGALGPPTRKIRKAGLLGPDGVIPRLAMPGNYLRH